MGKNAKQNPCTHGPRVYSSLSHSSSLFFSSPAKVVLQRLCCLSFLTATAGWAGAKAKQAPGSEQGSAEFGWWMGWISPTGHCPSHGDTFLIQGIWAGLSELGASEEKVPLTLWWGMLGSCWVMAENPKRSQQMLGEKPGSWRRCSRWVSVAKCYLRSCRWVGSSGDNCKGNKDSSFCTKGDQCQGMVRGWVLLFIGKLFELCLYTITHSKHLVLSSAPVGEGQM